MLYQPNIILGDKILYQYGSVLFPKTNFSSNISYQSSTKYDENPLTEIAIPNRVYDNNLVKPYEMDLTFVITQDMGGIDAVLNELFNKSLKSIFFQGLKPNSKLDGSTHTIAWYYNRAETVSADILFNEKDRQFIENQGKKYIKTAKIKIKFERAGFYELNDNLYFIDLDIVKNALKPTPPTLPTYGDSKATYNSTTRYNVPFGLGFDLDYYITTLNAGVDANNMTEDQINKFVATKNRHPTDKLYYRNFFFPEYNLSNQVYVRGSKNLNDNIDTIAVYLNEPFNSTTGNGFALNNGLYVNTVYTDSNLVGTLDLATSHTNDVMVVEISGTIPQGYSIDIFNQSNNSGFTFTWLKNTYNDPNNPIQIYVHEGLVFSGDNVYLPETDGTSYVYSVSEKLSAGNLYFDGLLSSDPLITINQGQRIQISTPILANALLKIKILKTFY